MNLTELNGMNKAPCNIVMKQIKRSLNYGEPKGIMLVVFGIDYSNSTVPKEKNEA